MAECVTKQRTCCWQRREPHENQAEPRAHTERGDALDVTEMHSKGTYKNDTNGMLFNRITV